MHTVIEYLANTKSPVQLVKHFEEVLPKNIKYPLFVQNKYDGVYVAVVVYHGKVIPFSRTGKPYYFERFTQVFPNLKDLSDGVYIGELCNSLISLEILSGLVNPNRVKTWKPEEWDKMHVGSKIHFHDYLIVDDFLRGHAEVTYLKRHTALSAVGSKYGIHVIPYREVHTIEGVYVLAEHAFNSGEEGIVIKQDVDWVAGHKGYRAMKLVKGVVLDLLCTGVVYGKGKRAGQIAALELEFNGNTFKADLGKGWTDERRKAITLAHDSGTDTTVFPDSGSGYTEVSPIGKIWEVKALDYSSTGKALRLPKVVRVRLDKDVPDA